MEPSRYMTPEESIGRNEKDTNSKHRNLMPCYSRRIFVHLSMSWTRPVQVAIV